MFVLFFFFNDTATTEIYTLSLHDALPISAPQRGPGLLRLGAAEMLVKRVEPLRGDLQPQGAAAEPLDRQHGLGERDRRRRQDRKSTRLNSSHANISYAVFCLKKKKK